MRRSLIIAAIVIVILGLGVVAYFYFFPSTASVTTAPGAATGAGLPVAGQGAPLPGETTGAGTSGAATTPNAPTEVSAQLVKISAGPVVPGEAVVSKEGTASSSPEAVVSYIERQSGNVYTYDTFSKTLTRISNKTIPGIQSAEWLPNASTSFVRYLSGADFSTINTYALSADGGGGFFLPQNLAGISVSSASIMTLASGVNGSSVSIERTDGTHSTGIFTTPLSAIRVSFSGKNQYLVYTKPSSSLAGDAFLVDSTGHFSRIAGPLSGLSALASPLGKWVLVSYALNGALQMQLISTATGVALPLPVATIADKCVWTSDDSSFYCGIPMNPPLTYNYPDDWYQGVVHFSDRIWKVNTTGRYAQLVLDFSKETNAVLDAEALAIDPLGTTLVFINKNDDSLWSYSL